MLLCYAIKIKDFSLKLTHILIFLHPTFNNKMHEFTKHLSLNTFLPKELIIIIQFLRRVNRILHKNKLPNMLKIVM